MTLDNSTLSRLTECEERPPSVLASPGQLRAEGRARTILERPEMAEARTKIAALFRADRNARLADQDDLIEQSVAEHCLHAALIAAGETPHHPAFVWTIALPRKWQGQILPGSRMGQDNPDNVYRFASVDPARRYVIRGRFAGEAPTDFSICSLPAQVGEGIAADVCGIITRDSLDVDADGGFEITVDNNPTEGRRNHLCIAGAKVLMGRDTLGDWSIERPSSLQLELTDGDTVDSFDLNSAAPRAAYLACTIAEFFLTKVQHGMCEVGPLNTVPAPVASAGRGGLVTQTAALGYYRLGEDEVLVLTLDPLGARYLGVQICDMWMLSYDYSYHTSSLNHRQAMADNDGRIRMVIAAGDPGVHNWLDGSGSPVGTVLLRWHSIPAGADFAGAVHVDLVKGSELKQHLPAETRYLSAAERQAQREKRLNDYLCRVYADNP